MELIAEIGQVHEGSLGLALNYIDELKKHGVNVIKFQMHLPDYESSEYEKWRVPFSKQDEKRQDYWRRTSFTPDEWKIISEYCKDNDVEFLCTPFSLKAVDYLEELDVKRYKVGSADWNSLPLLRRVKETGKPVILSCGLSNMDVLYESLNEIFEHDFSTLSLMYCVTAYPAAAEMINFDTMLKLKEKFKCPVGYSDHSGNYLAGLAAYFNDADFYEFHITSSYSNFGPDVAASLDYMALENLQKGLQFSSKLGLNEQSEKAKESVSKIFSRSLSVRKSIKLGSPLTFDDIEIKKPQGYGIPVNDYEAFLGKKLKRDIEVGEFLNLEDFDE